MESGALITVDIVDGIGLVLYISQSKDYVKILKLVILFAGMAAIFHGDHISIMAVSEKKSGLETNAHRYLILFFHDRCHRTRRLCLGDQPGKDGKTHFKSI